MTQLASDQGNTSRPRSRGFDFKLDLGLGQLTREWRRLFTREGLRQDTVAGITVACIAVPLSLAIALASGVPPAVGLVTAIVAGIVCALFGGTPLAVSGPAAAMAVLIASVVERHGVGGLLVVGIGCGLLQLTSGVLRVGRLARYVPVPVIAGFTAGIGAIILIGQAPRALGLPPPPESHVFDVVRHIRDEIHNANLVALGLALTAAALCVGLPKLLPKVPAALVAVVVPTLAAVVFGLPAPTVGAIPRSLPMPHLPVLPDLAGLRALIGPTFIVYALASLETLLSSSAVDKLAANGKRHDPDQELIGQGLGNLSVALFGGIPVTGVIARSALNVQSGARTRRSAIIHSLTLMVIVFFLAPLIARIPLAALAGVLLAVALRMINLGELRAFWRASRAEAAVYLLTFGVIVVGDLIAGVQVGLVAAFFVAAVRLGQTHFHLERRGPDHARVALHGALTFLSTNALDPLRQALLDEKTPRELIIDLSDLRSLDVTGAELLTELVDELDGRGTRVVLVGLKPALEPFLRGSDPDGHVIGRLARSEGDVHRLFDASGPFGRPIDRLVHGVQRFRAEQLERYQPLFDSLATKQVPHTLFITCSDSRIVPTLITSCDPGELFILRNVGNIIPPFLADALPAEGAAIEFAVAVLGCSEIVVCGHSGCGAMKALLSDAPVELPSLRQWLDHARNVRRFDPGSTPESAAQLNALVQLEHLATYPAVRQRLAQGKLRLHAWFYDIGGGQLYRWDDDAGGYVPLTGAAAHEVVAPAP